MVSFVIYLRSFLKLLLHFSISAVLNVEYDGIYGNKLEDTFKGRDHFQINACLRRFLEIWY